MPFADASFDLVTCLDVIEHTPDDRRTLRELRRVTRPGGTLVVTVPAYQALWSAHDVVNGHYRRYRRPELRAAAQEAGWLHVRDSYFNALLLGPAAIVRLTRRRAGADSGRSELGLTPGGSTACWNGRCASRPRCCAAAPGCRSGLAHGRLHQRRGDRRWPGRGAAAPACIARQPHRTGAGRDGVRTLAGLSVVLACLNDEENIERAVRSSADAADQASDEYEVIVVDDGSRDGSLPVASGFARRDPHVRVLVHAGTRGYGAAVRTGIGAARMPWILLTDAGLPVDPHEARELPPADRGRRSRRRAAHAARRPVHPPPRGGCPQPARPSRPRRARPRRRLRLQAGPARAGWRAPAQLQRDGDRGPSSSFARWRPAPRARGGCPPPPERCVAGDVR